MTDHPTSASGTAYLSLVLDHAPVILFATDTQGVLTLSQGQGLAALGLAPGEVVGQSVFEAYADEPELIAQLRRALAGEAFAAIMQVGERTYQTSFQPLRGPSGALLGLAGISVDLTRQVQSQRQVEALLSLSELMDSDPGQLSDEATLTAVLRMLSTTMPLDFLILWQQQGDVFTGLAQHGAVPEAGEGYLHQGVSATYMKTLGVLDGAPLFAAHHRLPAEVSQLGITGLALLPLTVAGQTTPLLLGVYRTGSRPHMDWSAEEQHLLVAAARSIAVSRGRQVQGAALDQAAHRDALTGLGNRRAFLAGLGAVIRQATVQGTSVGLLSIDLDGLKYFNDLQGHERGDALLRQCGAALEAAFESPAQCYRLGGDEFAVILPGLIPEQVRASHERLEQVVAGLRQHGFEQAAASGGVAVFPADAPDLSALIQRADQRLYQAKEGVRTQRARPERQRIVVVEDQPGMARLIELTLQGAGYRVEVLHDAQTARTRLRQGGTDLLITDLALPEGREAGIDLLRELRASGLPLPVLFLSANLDLQVRVTGLQAGGDDFLVKPFQRSELLARVEVLLRRAHGSRAARHSG
jgi:diguanylate cyclase (GGDEF)-like protein